MYLLYYPDFRLQPYIESYWMLRLNSRIDSPLAETIVVDGKADILFNFGTAYRRRSFNRSIDDEVQKANLDGQRDYPVFIHQIGTIHLVGVRFRPGGLSVFMRHPVHQLHNQVIQVDDSLGAEACELEARLFDASSDTVRQSRLLDQFFLARLNPPPLFAIAQSMARHIEHRSASLRIHTLSSEFGYSIRTVDRLFRQVYGVTPKLYARIARFQRAFEQIPATAPGRLADLALQLGYFDQAHFAREFAQFAGLTPNQYRQQTLDKAAKAVQFLQAGDDTCP